MRRVPSEKSNPAVVNAAASSRLTAHPHWPKGRRAGSVLVRLRRFPRDSRADQTVGIEAIVSLERSPAIPPPWLWRAAA
jgi:hypothetical protein